MLQLYTINSYIPPNIPQPENTGVLIFSRRKDKQTSYASYALSILNWKKQSFRSGYRKIQKHFISKPYLYKSYKKSKLIVFKDNSVVLHTRKGFLPLPLYIQNCIKYNSQKHYWKENLKNWKNITEVEKDTLFIQSVEYWSEQYPKLETPWDGIGDLETALKTGTVYPWLQISNNDTIKAQTKYYAAKLAVWLYTENIEPKPILFTPIQLGWEGLIFSQTDNPQEMFLEYLIMKNTSISSLINGQYTEHKDKIYKTGAQSITKKDLQIKGSMHQNIQALTEISDDIEHLKSIKRTYKNFF